MFITITNKRNAIYVKYLLTTISSFHAQ